MTILQDDFAILMVFFKGVPLAFVLTAEALGQDQAHPLAPATEHYLSWCRKNQFVLMWLVVFITIQPQEKQKVNYCWPLLVSVSMMLKRCITF